MRKILLLTLLLFCVSGLFAQNYPVIMNNGTILINTGIGFGWPVTYEDKDKATNRVDGPLCPPLTVSFDAALPIAGLPLTVGITIGYLMETLKQGCFYILPVAARIAYHLPFNVPRLDTYAVLTLGAAIVFDAESKFWFGLGAGGRYFFLPYMGAYLELGFGNVQNITFGLSFKI
jgi:hypothetical protein